MKCLEQTNNISNSKTVRNADRLLLEGKKTCRWTGLPRISQGFQHVNLKCLANFNSFQFVIHLTFFLEKFVLSHKRYLLNLNFRRLISIWWEGSMPVRCFSIKKELTQFKQVLILANGTIFEWYRNYVILTATTTKNSDGNDGKFWHGICFYSPMFFSHCYVSNFSPWKKLEDYSTSWFYFHSTS